MDQKRVRTRQAAMVRTYSEASRNTGTVGGEAGLSKGVDIVGGEICNYLELELGGERKPTRHCRLCQSLIAFYSMSKKKHTWCVSVCPMLCTHRALRTSAEIFQLLSSVAVSLISSLSPSRLCSPAVHLGRQLPDALGGSLRLLYDLLILSHAVVGRSSRETERRMSAFRGLGAKDIAICQRLHSEFPMNSLCLRSREPLTPGRRITRSLTLPTDL